MLSSIVGLPLFSIVVPSEMKDIEMAAPPSVYGESVVALPPRGICLAANRHPVAIFSDH